MQILNQGPFTQNFGMQEEKERKVLGNFFTPKNTPPKVKNSKLDKRLIFWDTLQLYLAIYQSLAGHLHFAISNQLSLASNLCISQLEIKLQKSLSLAISGNHQPVITSNPLHSLAIPSNPWQFLAFPEPPPPLPLQLGPSPVQPTLCLQHKCHRAKTFELAI